MMPFLGWMLKRENIANPVYMYTYIYIYVIFIWIYMYIHTYLYICGCWCHSFFDVDPRVSAINLLSCQACLHRMVALSRRGVAPELQDGFPVFFGMKNLGFSTMGKYSLSQWPNFKLLGITYWVGKIKFKLFFFRVHWLSENIDQKITFWTQFDESIFQKGLFNHQLVDGSFAER